MSDTTYYKGYLGFEDLSIGFGTFVRKDKDGVYRQLTQINREQFNVDWYFDVRDYNSLDNAIDYLKGLDTSEDYILVVPVECKIDIDIDLSNYSNIYIWLLQNGRFNISTGYTFTFYSMLNISFSKNRYIFKGSGLYRFYNTGGEFCPENWGAKGDSVTNDYSALQACFDSNKSLVKTLYDRYGDDYTYSSRLWVPVVLTFGSVYRSETQLFIGGSADNCVKEIIGNGAVIVGADAGKPILDMTGAGLCRLNEVTLSGDEIDVPSIGIFLARYSDDVSAGLHEFNKVTILGHFTISGVYNYASEANLWNGCRIILEEGLSCFILTSSNSRSITSDNTTTATGAQSSINQKIDGGQLWNNESSSGGTNASCLELDCWSKVTIKEITFNTNTTDKPMIWIRATSIVPPATINILNNLFHADYDKAIYIDLTVTKHAHALLIEGNHWGSSTNDQQVVASAASDVYDSRIIARNIDFSAVGADFKGINYLSVGADSQTVTSINITTDFSGGEIHVLSDTTVTLPATFKGRIFNDEDGTFTVINGLSSYSDTSTSGTGEDTLKSSSIPANALRNKGKIKIKAVFDFTGSAGNKTIKFKIGAGPTSYTVFPAASSSDFCYFEAELYASTATTQRLVIKTFSGTSVIYTIYAALTEDITAAINFLWTGECADGGDAVVQKFYNVTCE